MNYMLREIRAEDIERIRPQAEHRHFIALFPEWRREFLDLIQDPDCYDGYTVELESGEILGIGLMILGPLNPSVGVMCVYATHIFKTYPLVVVRAAKEIIRRVIERNNLSALVAYADKEDSRIPRWCRAFGFELIPTPPDAPAKVRDLDFYMLRCTNG